MRYLPSVLLIGTILMMQPWLRGDTVADLAKWQISGSVTVDKTKHAPGSGYAFKVEPDSTAKLKLRDKDASGTLTLDVYDDGTIASPGAERSVGPRWGFILADGRVFVVGIFYAPYVEENGSYCIVESTGGKDPVEWNKPQFVASRGEPGWKKWKLNFDAVQGFTVTVDDKPASKHFEWSKTDARGFCGLALYGDSTPSAKGSPQAIWVSGINYVLGGPMTAKPVQKP